ncbi:threonine/serine exporter family protein [Tissierella sp. P1]|uniref:threonine/serine exporter family protein n=1 Tax=Tissierella sp. P1 TaxID=1280483 RepID=UPI003514CF95
MTIVNLISKLELTFFIDNLIGSALAALLSHILVHIGVGENIDKVIIGSIMCLVPGVAITNSIRDTMSGDFVSGLSRGAEAVFSAIAIALGVGIILNFYAKGVF